MRDDFSKQLVERERTRSWDKFHNYRNVKGPKGLNDGEVGGRESMRRKFNHGYDRKHFNENLNPLYGWVRSCLGKNWDRCYSELRRKFDARSVINNHILEHLWGIIETHTFVDEHGRSMARPGNYSSTGAVPVSECLKDHYVCPKSGMVRATQKKTHRQIRKLRAAERVKEEAKVKRFVDGGVLRLIDGVWYRFDLLEVPKISIKYERPPGRTEFECGSWGKKVLKRWEELNEAERKEHGVQVRSGGVRDEFTRELLYKYDHTPSIGRKGCVPRVRTISNIRGEQKYHANKRTASKKDLRDAEIRDCT